jgi:predicted metal-dependent RNase
MSYLKSFSSRTDVTLFLAGFQALGTLGHALSEGQRSFDIDEKR